MQQPTSSFEHPDTATTSYKRPLEGLQQEQGWPSKRVCARQAGEYTVPGEQIQQQHADCPGKAHQHVSNSNQQQPHQQQLQVANSGQQLSTAGQDTQQAPRHSQPVDADAVVIVHVLPRRTLYEKVGHSQVRAGACAGK